jgi:hypothetical protein
LAAASGGERGATVFVLATGKVLHAQRHLHQPFEALARRDLAVENSSYTKQDRVLEVAPVAVRVRVGRVGLSS